MDLPETPAHCRVLLDGDEIELFTRKQIVNFRTANIELEKIVLWG